MLNDSCSFNSCSCILCVFLQRTSVSPATHVKTMEFARVTEPAVNVCPVLVAHFVTQLLQPVCHGYGQYRGTAGSESSKCVGRSTGRFCGRNTSVLVKREAKTYCIVYVESHLYSYKSKRNRNFWHFYILGTSCTPACENGGTCNNGKCSCPTGYSGDSCATGEYTAMRCSTLLGGVVHCWEV